MSHFDQVTCCAIFRERLAAIHKRVNRVESLVEQGKERLVDICSEVHHLQSLLRLQTKVVLKELQEMERLTAKQHRQLSSSAGSGSQLESCDYDYLISQYLDTVRPEACDGPGEEACDILHQSPYKQRATEKIRHDSDYTSDTDSLLLRRNPSPQSPEYWIPSEDQNFLSEEDEEAELYEDEELKRRRRKTL